MYVICIHYLWVLFILVGKIFPCGLALLDGFTRALKLSVPW